MVEHKVSHLRQAICPNSLGPKTLAFQHQLLRLTSQQEGPQRAALERTPPSSPPSMCCGPPRHDFSARLQESLIEIRELFAAASLLVGWHFSCPEDEDSFLVFLIIKADMKIYPCYSSSHKPVCLSIISRYC